MAWGRGLQAQTPYNPNVIQYINTYKGIAIREEQRSGIPASIILAQGIHETEAGTSELVKNSNNHFGIKCKDDWKGPAVYHDDDARGECFRSYATPEESYRDHSDFLRGSSRYAALFQYNPENYEQWAYGLKKAGYATNPRYPEILIKLIRDYNLNQYTLIAVGKLRPEDEVVPGAGMSAPVLVAGEPTPSDTAAGNDAHGGDAVLVQPSYPDGLFTINNTRVIFARAGVSLLSIANQYELPLGRLLDFNDLHGLRNEDILADDQLIFLQRKRRSGATEFHVVRPGETLYTICQSEGLRLDDLLRINALDPGAKPVIGQQLRLQGRQELVIHRN